MNALRASPETSVQYCQTPTWPSPAGSWSAPPMDQWVNAMCWPSGKVAPFSSALVHGSAMNLERGF